MIRENGDRHPAAIAEGGARVPERVHHVLRGVSRRIASLSTSAASAVLKALPPAVAYFVAFHAPGVIDTNRYPPHKQETEIGYREKEDASFRETILETAEKISKDVSQAIQELAGGNEVQAKDSVKDFASDNVDLIEVNHFYDEQGRLVFDQVIFYDWDPASSHFHVRAWRLMKEEEQFPNRNWMQKAGFKTVWHDGEILRRVTAKSFRESWTQSDPELKEREILPQEERPQLAKMPVPKEIPAEPLAAAAPNPPIVQQPNPQPAPAGDVHIPPANEQPGAPAVAVPAQEKERKPEPSLFEKVHWISFDLKLGKFTARSSRYCSRHNMCHDAVEEGKPNERINLNVANGSPSLRYESADKRQKFVMEIINGNEVAVTQEPLNESEEIPVKFHQAPEGGVQLSIGEGKAGQIYIAKSILHLCLQEPEASLKYLTPLLQRIRPDLNVSETASKIELELLRRAQNREEFPRDDLINDIKKLGSPIFSKRSAAEKRITALGPQALPLLENINPLELDAEQRIRLRNITNAMRNGAGDTVESAASMLMGDQSVWFTFLSHDDAPIREIAFRKLSQIHGRKIPFDAGAEKEVREQQLKKFPQSLRR